MTDKTSTRFGFWIAHQRTVEPSPDPFGDSFSEAARQELDALSAALRTRITALEAAVANPSKRGSLPKLALDVARVAVDEAQAATRRVIIDAKARGAMLHAKLRQAEERIHHAQDQPLQQPIYKPLRRASRQVFHEKIEIQVDSGVALLADLSTSGAQLLSETSLKPNRPVKLLLPLADDADGTDGFVTCKGNIVWAQLEPSPGGLRYRAGVCFTAVDESGVIAFVARHR